MKNKNWIEAPENLDIKKKSKYYVFLAGPIQGAPDWQKEIITRFEKKWKDEVLFCNPRRSVYQDGEFNYQEQVDWETTYLNVADLILFWIPPMETSIEGRSYAQTTRTELGEWLDKCKTSGKPMILGIDPSISGFKYIQKRAPEDFGIKVIDNFDMVCQELELNLKKLHDPKKTWFISDTHFGSSRALELSKRPFINTRDMDMTMIRNWNSRVSPNDVVYHLGDFGNYDVMKYLNGNVTLVTGNYEKDEQNVSGLGMIDFYDHLILDYGFKGVSFKSVQIEIPGIGDVVLTHEPLDAKAEKDVDFSLFGHIHGRQRMKRYGMDIGVDANYFRPTSEEEIIFYYEAIKKYYDSNVFE